MMTLSSHARSCSAQFPRCDPYERIEPVDRAGNTGQHTNERISPGNVRELMTQNDLLVLIGPFARTRRKDDESFGNSRRERSAHSITREQSHVALDAKT